jgi:hypothetical protein
LSGSRRKESRDSCEQSLMPISHNQIHLRGTTGAQVL